MTTKELLIEKAFSFYSEPCVKDFSLNELAAKVGISKPAIYRHFKNKEDLMSEMRKHFFDLISEHLSTMKSNGLRNTFTCGTADGQIPFSSMVKFFADNPSHINYLLFQFSKQPNFESVIFDELKARDCLDEESMRNFEEAKSGKSMKSYADSFYCGISILIFVKLREKMISETENEKQRRGMDPTDVFAKKISAFINGGFAGACEEGDPLYPTAISAQRKSELERICQISKEDFPEENKIFTALASVIEKHDFNGVTIERIADELGMAKSSLYFYFDNKNEMILSLIEKELAMLTQLCVENASESRNFSEFIYLTMRTEMEFFHTKPSLLQICGWLLQTSSEEHSHLDADMHTTWEKKIPKALERPDIGLPLSPNLFRDWIVVVPVALFLVGTKKRMAKDYMLDYLEQIFGFIQFGIKNDKDKN